MIRIELKFKDAVLKEIESDQDEITIGRNADNDIQIDSMAISGHHAKLADAEGFYYIEELGRTNGTFVNEERINKHVLKENDEISIGKHMLIISFKKRSGIGAARKSNIERTYNLETQKHKEMLKKQPR
jgi:pSer/pThr/pTyr-binding forkhead associated (FHA) protein